MSAWRSKYSHQIAATAAKPRTAVDADETRQLAPETPTATATTDSPSTIRVKSAHRSGRCVALVGIRRWSLVENGGRLSSKICATTHTAWRQGVETASETSHVATPIEPTP